MPRPRLGKILSDAFVQYLSMPMRCWLGGVRPAFEQLAEQTRDDLLPPVYRKHVDESSLTPDQRAWRRDGVLVKRGFIPDALVAAYCSVREAVAERGWRSPVPYM